MNRNIILGKDWLTGNGVRVYYDLGAMRIKNVYVPLQEDIHVSSLARLKTNTKIMPQSSTLCACLIKKSPLYPSASYVVTPVETGFLRQHPGLMIVSSVSNLKSPRTVPLLIVNNTNKTYTLKRKCVLAQIAQIDQQNITVSAIKQGDGAPTTEGDIDFSQAKVSSEHKDQMINLLQRNRDLFAKSTAQLTQTETLSMNIDVGQSPPISLRPYRTPLNMRQYVDKAVDEMLEAGIISPSESPWAFPIVIVKKKADGTNCQDKEQKSTGDTADKWRFCVDYRALNKVTKRISHPLPLIDDILASLGKARYFTTLDMISGYWQIPMSKSSKELTAFTCHRGLFQFNRMPFGLVNAPAIFTKLVNSVGEGLSNFLIAYLDDLLIFSETLEDHLSHIQTVFNRLRQHNLKLKLKKCSFMEKTTKYLGFIVDALGIRPDPSKVQVIQSLPTPTTVTQVRGIIGMLSYYRRFIPKFSEIAIPLIELTKKYAHFRWDNVHQVAFDTLKSKLAALPLLGHPDINKPYILYTDASNYAVGALLTQPIDQSEQNDGPFTAEKPICYLSHKLSPTQRRYSTTEREAFAINWAVDKLNHYLQNSRFTIKTDHKPLKYLLESPMHNQKIQRYSLNLSCYDCVIEYLPGKLNACADLLSRIPPEAIPQDPDYVENEISDKFYQVNTLNSNRFNPRDFASCHVDTDQDLTKPEIDFDCDMSIEQKKDDALMEVKVGLMSEKMSPKLAKRYLVIDDILYFISSADEMPELRLYIPSHLKAAVIQQYHDDAGHMGIDHTYAAIKSKYYWPNLYKDLHKHINACVLCQSRNLQKIDPPVQQTDIPPYPFAKIALDLSGPYPTTLSGNKYIIGFICLYSGFPEIFACDSKEADNVCHLLIDEIIPRYGAPLALVTDNGSENVNYKVRELLESQRVHHIKTSFYNPAGNSKIERFHRSLHDVLAKKLQNNLQTWDLYLNQVVAAIRFTVNETTKLSPFYMVFGRSPVMPLDTILKPRAKYVGTEPYKIAIQEQHRAFLLAHKRIRKAQKKRAHYANKHTKEVEFFIGAPVYYKNHLRKSKLESRWKPYYRIIEQKSPVTFVIKNELDSQTIKTHARHLRLAKIEDWDLPVDAESRTLRRANYVEPLSTDSDSSSTNSDTDDNIPLSKLADRYRQQLSDSESERNIPLRQLKKQVEYKRSMKTNQADSQDELPSLSSEQNDNKSHSSGEEMNIDSVKTVAQQGVRTNEQIIKLLSAVCGLIK